MGSDAWRCLRFGGAALQLIAELRSAIEHASKNIRDLYGAGLAWRGYRTFGSVRRHTRFGRRRSPAWAIEARSAPVAPTESWGPIRPRPNPFPKG